MSLVIVYTGVRTHVCWGVPACLFMSALINYDALGLQRFGITIPVFLLLILAATKQSWDIKSNDYNNKHSNKDNSNCPKKHSSGPVIFTCCRRIPSRVLFPVFFVAFGVWNMGIMSQWAGYGKIQLAMWAVTWDNSQIISIMECAHSEDSDQSAHSHSLIRGLSGRSVHSKGSMASTCQQRRLVRLRECIGLRVSTQTA